MSGFLCGIPVLAGLLGCGAPEPLAVGYVEGEYVQIAPVATAELIEVPVRQGDRVAEGDVVARQEATDAEIALAEAEATRSEARAELADLREGSRPEEIQVIEASLEAARVRMRLAEREAERQTALATRRVVSEATLDTATAARDTARTEVAQMEAELAVARLPARPDRVEAAGGKVRGAEAAVRQAEWALGKRVVASPAAGPITDVLRRTGELAGPTAPVATLLPDGAVKLVLYAPEAAAARLAPGDRLAVRCDGCPDGLTARVSYIADGPEFTPPVIYSLETRQKLVYRIEARPETGPEGDAVSGLRPGQIVDVTLTAR